MTTPSACWSGWTRCGARARSPGVTAVARGDSVNELLDTGHAAGVETIITGCHGHLRPALVMGPGELFENPAGVRIGRIDEQSAAGRRAGGWHAFNVGISV